MTTPEPRGFRIPLSHGPAVRKLIADAGTTAAELAATVGVTRQFMSLLLNGKRGTRMSVAWRICEELGVPEYDLFVDPLNRPARFAFVARHGLAPIEPDRRGAA